MIVDGLKEADQSSIQQGKNIMGAIKVAKDAQTTPLVAPPS
jgi:hypothetical protein